MLVSYADGEPFATRQRTYATSALRHGIHHVKTWNLRRLNATAWARALPLSDYVARYGPAARWVWKPYLILDALDEMAEGDFVIYADASRHHGNGFNHSVAPLLRALAADAARGRPARAPGPPARPSATLAASIDPAGHGAWGRAHRHAVHGSFGMVPGLRLPLRNSACVFWNGINLHACHHTKVRRCDLCDVLGRLGLCAAADEACCDSFYHAPAVQASFSVWQANDHVRAFLRAWQSFTEDLEVLGRCKWGDQSVLALVTEWWSRHAGLRLPYLYVEAPSQFERSQELKDADAFFARFHSAESVPPFLLNADPYPECSAASAWDAMGAMGNETMCTRP